MASFTNNNFYLYLDSVFKSMKYNNIEQFRLMNTHGKHHYLHQVEATVLMLFPVCVEGSYTTVAIEKKGYDCFFTWKEKDELKIPISLQLHKSDLEAFIHHEGAFYFTKFVAVLEEDPNDYRWPDGSDFNKGRYWRECIFPALGEFIEIEIHFSILKSSHARSVKGKEKFVTMVHELAKTIVEQEIEDKMIEDFVYNLDLETLT